MPNAHGSLVNAVISYINARGGYVWKNQSGTLPVGNRFVHLAKPGTPDVVGVWPVGGRMICVEVKTGTGRLSAAQRRVHAELTKRGALVLVIRTISELQEALR